MNSIAGWTHTVHELAKQKGWWSLYENGDAMPPATPREVGGLHMLMVTEISEATEAARNGEPPMWQFNEHSYKCFPGDPEWRKEVKPEGELIELADVVIRIMDYCGMRKWDLEQAIKIKHEYNATRPHRHGGKSF